MKDESGRTLESMSQATWYNQWTKGQFSEYLSGDILEVGCGIGNFSTYLTNYGKLTAIDINENYITEAKKKINEQTKVGLGNIETGKYFFKDKIFNAIVCINVLEHIKDDVKALKNIFKLLSPDGNLILLVPANKFLYNLIDESIGHYRRYQKEELKQLLKEVGFEILKIRNLNFLGGLGWFIVGKLFKDNQITEKRIKIFNLVSPPFLLFENIFEPPLGTSVLAIVRRRNK